MRFVEPTADQIAGYKDWVAARPAIVRDVAERFNPWTLYRMKSTKHRVYMTGFAENEDGKVTVRVGIDGRFNHLSFEREVFGIDPDDLEECELPGPEEVVGSHEFPVEVVRELHNKYPDGVPDFVIDEFWKLYPLKPSRCQ